MDWSGEMAVEPFDPIDWFESLNTNADSSIASGSLAHRLAMKVK